MKIERVIFSYLTVTIIILWFSSCSLGKLPKQKLAPLHIDKTIEYQGDSLYIYIENQLHCPMRFPLSSGNEMVDKIVNQNGVLLVPPLQDTTLIFRVSKEDQSEIDIKVKFGDVDQEIVDLPIRYPFPDGKSYKIIQGNNSKPTHYTVNSQYALDFSMRVNDTICAATDGFVVGVIEGYEHGGTGKKWKSYGNYVLIYQPTTGRYFQYGHLIHNGSLVELGDRIEPGQPIALSGLTGQTSVEHLHFNCYVPTKDGKTLRSYPVKFETGTAGKDLKRGHRVKN